MSLNRCKILCSANNNNKSKVTKIQTKMYLIIDLVAISQRTTFSSSPPVTNRADEVENAQTRIGEPLEC